MKTRITHTAVAGCSVLLNSFHRKMQTIVSPNSTKLLSNRNQHPHYAGGNGLFSGIILAIGLWLLPAATQAQWTTLSSGTTEDLYELMFPAADTGYVVGSRGTFLKTTNGGQNWTSLSIAGSSKDFHELYFLNTREGWVVGDSGQVCKTTNGGQSWNCTFPDSAAFISLHSIYARNNQELWIGGSIAGTDGYIAKSVDGGLTWQKAQVESYIWNQDFLKIGMVNPQVGYALTRGSVLKTTDGGASWKITDTASVRAGNMFSILEDLAFFPNSDTLYVCGWYPKYLGKSVNGGLTWEHQFNYDYYNLDFLNTQTGYVGGWGYLHKTTDGGNTFVDASGGDPATFSDIYSIDFTDEWNGYACGPNGKLIKTDNGGATGIKETEDTKYTLRVYPNPTSDRLFFSERVDVRLTDLTGVVVAEENNTNSLSLSTLPSGIYLANLRTRQGQSMLRYPVMKNP